MNPSAIRTIIWKTLILALLLLMIVIGLWFGREFSLSLVKLIRHWSVFLFLLAIGIFLLRVRRSITLAEQQLWQHIVSFGDRNNARVFFSYFAAGFGLAVIAISASAIINMLISVLIMRLR